jgi:hypothetical protein
LALKIHVRHLFSDNPRGEDIERSAGIWNATIYATGTENIDSVSRSVSSSLLQSSCLPSCTPYSGPGHSTTTIGGKFQSDPSGNHFTFCYKSEQQVQTQTHIACHGYTPSPTDYSLTKATFSTEKLDSMPKKRNNKPVWPAVAGLDVGPEIGYQH